MTSARPNPTPRNDGWTAARQQGFLEALADSGSVAVACRRVGMSRTAAYRLRRHPDARDFRDGWDLALAEALRQVEHVAIERALHGEEEVIERDGVTFIVRRRPCDARLLVRLLDRIDAQEAARRDAAAREVAALRTIIDGLTDRRDWLPEPADPALLAQVERLAPPLRLLVPADATLAPAGRRARVRADV